MNVRPDRGATGRARERYDPERHHRHALRLKGYDYRETGAYFVTICTRARTPLFGELRTGDVHLSDVGLMIQRTWEELPRHYGGVELDAFVVMPDHLHGIILLTATAGPKALPLSDVIHRYKSLTTARYWQGSQAGWPPLSGALWQRAFYDHVVRDEEDLQRIRDYIVTNPARGEEHDTSPSP